MNFSFKKIDKEGFIRIWNSDYHDSYIDSHKKPFQLTAKDDWLPFFEKQTQVMNEVILDGQVIGYIFLSSKKDGSAHLGYGVYKEYRGKGLSLPMCKMFLNEKVSSLDEHIVKILGTTLKNNYISQKILLELGFTLIGEIEESGISYLRYEKKLKREESLND